MPYIKDINFSTTDTLHGCKCDKCGLWIKNIWTVSYSDNVTMHFGIDCYENMCKNSRLNDYGMKTMKKLLKKIETYTKEKSDFENGKITEDNCLQYKYIQEWGGYWKGKPFEEYRNWMITEVYDQRMTDCYKELQRFSKINFII